MRSHLVLGVECICRSPPHASYSPCPANGHADHVMKSLRTRVPDVETRSDYVALANFLANRLVPLSGDKFGIVSAAYQDFEEGSG